MSRQCSSLYLLINFGLKSILLDIKMVTQACFLGPFPWNIIFPFFLILSWCLSLMLGVFLWFSSRMDHVFPSILFVSVFLLGNWDHWRWEISISSAYWFLLFYCFSGGNGGDGMCIYVYMCVSLSLTCWSGIIYSFDFLHVTNHFRFWIFPF